GPAAAAVTSTRISRESAPPSSRISGIGGADSREIRDKGGQSSVRRHVRYRASSIVRSDSPYSVRPPAPLFPYPGFLTNPALPIRISHERQRRIREKSGLESPPPREVLMQRSPRGLALAPLALLALVGCPGSGSTGGIQRVD